MSRHGTVLPIPADAERFVQGMLNQWESGWYLGRTHPRSAWLGDMELLLRRSYPAASSRDLNVTARSLAPFPLTEKDWL